MRLTLLFTILLLTYNQTFSQAVLSSTGQTLQSASITIEYSIGEIGITTLAGNQNYVTQGLLQPIFRFKDCNLLLMIPSAFTPNKDNLNDCFGVKNWPATSSFELTIYNRWGQLIFKTNNILECWNGEFKSQPQPNGAYVYFIKAITATCGLVTNKGTVTLIR